MDYSRKIAERLWNMPDKGELESHREETFIRIRCMLFSDRKYLQANSAVLLPAR